MNTSRQFETIARALYWLVENQKEQPSLRELSQEFSVSEFHLQKVFQDFAGVSPKQFLKFLGKEAAISRLQTGRTVLGTALDIGLSGPSRLHDLLVSTEAVTPGEARRSGKGVHMRYGYGPSPFGDALIAWTSRGVGFLAFCNQRGRQQSFAQLSSQWSGAQFTEDKPMADAWLSRIFLETNNRPLKIWLKGSPFQLKVWEALLKIPPSVHCTYGQIAYSVGKPGASRAVGSAIGRNPVSWLIPCHRVITSIGTLGGYRWGTEVKQAMIGVEAGRSQQVA